MESLRTNGRKNKARRIMGQATGAVVEAMESRQLLAGTIQFVADLDATSSGNIGSITEYKGKALIENWNAEWYISGGTQASTVLLHKATSGFLDEIVATPGKAFARFWQDTGVKHDLWASDGTAAGTMKITPAGLDDDRGAHTAFGTKLFFAGRSSTDTADKPWISDGTAAGTMQLIDVPLASDTKPVEMGGYLYFLGGSGLNYSLYKTNGTAAGTSKIWDLPTGNAPSVLGTAGGNILVPMFGKFWSVTSAGAASNLKELFYTDQFVNLGTVAYFNAKGPSGDTAGEELWRSDGTAAGTYLVKDINPGTSASNPDFLVKVGTKIMFVATTAADGDEWWISDGSAAGTQMAGQVAAGTDGLNRSGLMMYGRAAVGNAVFFQYWPTDTGAELWQADGSVAGTSMVQNLVAGSGSSSPGPFAAVGSVLYFGATDETYHGELFKYTPDTAVNDPPTGVPYGTPTVSTGTAPMTIQVRWTDTDGINTATLSNGDITVTLPDFTTVAATYISYTGTATDLVATYQIAAPVGGWNSTHSGTYQVTANAGQVSDTQGLAISTFSLGFFNKTFTTAQIVAALTGTSVAENQPAGTAVGTLGVTGDGGTVTYTLVTGLGDTDNASFTLSGNQLLTAAIFDFETKASYSVRVRASGSTGASDEQVFTISVTDVAETANQAPTDITLGNAAIQENLAAGSPVGTLSATDPDAANLFTYTLVSGTGSDDNSAFTIVGDSLKSAAVFDYEAKNSYSIRIRVTDQGGLSYEKAFTINVTDTADTTNHAPTGLMLNGVTVAENLPVGTVVSTLGAVDPDPGDTFTFALVSGSGSTDNGLFTIDGNQLKTAAVFDYETKNTYSIRLRVTDQGGLWKEAATTIRVTDIAENETIGTFGMVDGKVVSLTLPFDGDLVTFKLSGGGTGVVKTDGSVALTGTTATSSLAISVKKGVGGDGYHTLTGITADGLLKGISATKVFVHGDISVNTSGAAAGTSAVAIRLAGMQDGDIDTHGQPIRSLKLLDWQDTDGDADQVHTPWIGGITVSGRKDVATTPANEALAGDWEADVLTSSSNAGTAIGAVKVAGSVAGAKLWANGAIKSILAKGAVSNSRIAAADGVGAVSAAELRDSDVLVGVASNFSDHFADTAADFANAAAKLGKLTVSGYRLAAGQIHPAYVTNSHISAAVYGMVSLANVPASTPLSPIIHVLSDTGVLKVRSLSSGMVAGGTWRGGVVTEPGQPERPNLVEQVI